MTHTLRGHRSHSHRGRNRRGVAVSDCGSVGVEERARRPTAQSIRPVRCKGCATYRLGEEVGPVHGALDEGDTEMLLIYVVSHEIPPTMDVPSACRRRAVHSEQSRPTAVGGHSDSAKSEPHLLQHLYTREQVTDAGAQTIKLRLSGR